MKKLYEFTGYVTHSVVIAADNEESAKKAFEALGANWACTGDEIGPDDVKDVELCDVRDVEKEDFWDDDDLKQVYDDLAHVVV